MRRTREGPDESARSPREERSERVKIPNRIVIVILFQRDGRAPFVASRGAGNNPQLQNYQWSPANNISGNLWHAAWTRRTPLTESQCPAHEKRTQPQDGK